MNINLFDFCWLKPVLDFQVQIFPVRSLYSVELTSIWKVPLLF